MTQLYFSVQFDGNLRFQKFKTVCNVEHFGFSLQNGDLQWVQCNFKGFSQRSSATKTQTVTQNRCLTALEKPKNIFYSVICQINAIEQVNYFVQLKRQFSSIKSCGYAILTFNRFLCTGLKFRPVEVDVHLMKYPFDIFSTILCFIQESCKSKNFHFLLFTYYYCVTTQICDCLYGHFHSYN